MIDEETPIGTAVIVRRDDGTELRTSTRSQTWWLIQRARPQRGRRVADKKKLVVLVHGISGCYDCERITVVSTRQLDLFGGQRR